MKISGFTIVRNIRKYHYPLVESIQSILPICDEFIVNVGDSEDDTLKIVQSISSPKIRIIQNAWDMSTGYEVLSRQTNLAMNECKGDWLFYLQADEVIHEDDLAILKGTMARCMAQDSVDVIRLRWLHFYGSYFRYRVDAGWYQKNDRMIRNNGQVESYGDAGGFRRKDGQPLRRKNSLCLLYHYGWVNSEEIMAQRRLNAIQIGFAKKEALSGQEQYRYGDVNQFPVYFGTHPSVMKSIIAQHRFSMQDWDNICRQYWYHPARIFRLRYKTFGRVKERLER
ncbi:MAG: glycosyltransferase [Candidatus Omnitrophica bacterium]|nr:glycosyltransferase [Candidatus Omnitrophota bacterium]